MLELAEAADSGFDRIRFAEALGVLADVTDTDFEMYGLPPGQLSAMRGRFANWRATLLGKPAP